MHPDDQPNDYPHFYVVPQSCGHPLEVRTKEPCPQKDFTEIVGETCMWCESKDTGLDAPQEFRTKWRGGMLIRQCPLTVGELVELQEIERNVMLDARPGDHPTSQ